MVVMLRCQVHNLHFFPYRFTSCRLDLKPQRTNLVKLSVQNTEVLYNFNHHSCTHFNACSPVTYFNLICLSFVNVS